MTRHRRLIVSGMLAAVLLTTACAGWFGHAAPAEDVDFAKAYIALFATRSYPAIEMGMDPTLKDPQIRQKVMTMASVIPPGEPRSVQLTSSRVVTTGNESTSELTFEYEYPDRWILANVVIGRRNHAPVIKGIHIQPSKEPLERINRITLSGKGVAHLIAVLIAALVFVFVLWTFVQAIRSPAPGMQWAWAIFVLVGVVRISFNWTTGLVTIVPMSLQLFGTTFSRPSMYEPLILTTSVPLGAIIYLIQRREWRQDGLVPPAPPPPGP